MKKIFKTHLDLTKNKKDPYLILDYNKYNYLLDLVESNYNFCSNSLITCLSLQGQERMTGYINQHDTFSFLNFHLNSPYEEIIIKLPSNTFLIIQRYSICTPKDENVFKNQVYQWTLITKNESKKSELLLPENGVYFTKDSFHFQESLVIKCYKNILRITINDLSYIVKIIDTIPNNKNFIIDIQKENHKTEIKRTQLFPNEEYSTIEHRYHYFINNYVNIIIYNITHTIQTEYTNKEISFFINFENINVFIETKDLMSFSIHENNMHFELLDNEEFIPSLWRLKYKNNEYYMKITNNIFNYNIYYLEEIYIVYYNITLEDKIIGYSWVKYRNLQDFKKIISKKINYLFKPLERPNVDFFIPQKIPVEGAIPSIITLIVFITFFIVLLILFIYQCYRIHSRVSQSYHQDPQIQPVESLYQKMLLPETSGLLL
jgi:hypothetical protein